MLVSKAQMGALERATADGGGRSLWKDARIRFFRNRAAAAALVVLILIAIFAFFGDMIAQYDGETIDWARMGDIAGQGAPSIENGHYFGLDELGRDLFARTVQGTRISLMVGVVGALIAVVVGTLYGAIAGYFGADRRHHDAHGRHPDGRALHVRADPDAGHLRTVDHDPVHRDRDDLWLDMARIARGQTLSIKNKEFVEAAVAIGVRPMTIICAISCRTLRASSSSMPPCSFPA